jgi:hypothetical protein
VSATTTGETSRTSEFLTDPVTFTAMPYYHPDAPENHAKWDRVAVRLRSGTRSSRRSRKFSVGDRVFVNPETADANVVSGCLFGIGVVVAHEKCTTGNATHSVGLSYAGNGSFADRHGLARQSEAECCGQDWTEQVHLDVGAWRPVAEIQAAQTAMQVDPRVERVVDRAHDLPVNVRTDPKAADITVDRPAEPVAEVAVVTRADQRVGPA